MSLTFVMLTMLLGSSMVIAFVLQPSRKEHMASANSPVSHQRCQSESLESIRKALLMSLHMQAEPQLPAGGLDAVQEQWRSTFTNTAHGANHAAVPAISGYSVSPDGGNSTGLKCCSLASEIFMKDLGWDSWVIHPSSLTIVHCALCNPEANTVKCPSFHTNVKDAESQVQVLCCRPTSEEMVPVVYVDESSTVVISSVQLTRSCGCGHEQPSQDLYSALSVGTKAKSRLRTCIQH